MHMLITHMHTHTHMHTVWGYCSLLCSI